MSVSWHISPGGPRESHDAPGVPTGLFQWAIFKDKHPAVPCSSRMLTPHVLMDYMSLSLVLLSLLGEDDLTCIARSAVYAIICYLPSCPSLLFLLFVCCQRMKNRTTLRKLTTIYKEAAPDLYSALISERDQVSEHNVCGQFTEAPWAQGSDYIQWMILIADMT